MIITITTGIIEYFVSDTLISHLSPLLSLLTTKKLIFFIFLFFCFLGLHPQHMEVPRLGVESELQPLAYTIATAMQDLSRIFNLQHSWWQCWILNLLSEVRNRTHNFMGTSWVRFHCVTTGTPKVDFIIIQFLLIGGKRSISPKSQ